ncbi:MAG: TetR/AcrR family transcriptional regulator [Myxococcota bacterium]
MSERATGRSKPDAGAPGASRRPQARGLATRARLLAAAEGLFTRYGYEGTSIGDVAARAGVGVGTVYHHFADKQALLLQLIDDWGDRVEAQAAPDAELERFLSGDVRASFSRWLRSSYERLRKRPSLYLLVLDRASRDPAVAERYRRVESLITARMRRLLEVGCASGALRRDLDVGAASVLIANAIDVAATQLLVRGVADPDPDRVIEGLNEMICRYIVETRDPGHG